MEADYDIFISFKNSDKNGETKDRELAYRLYEFLKSKNLKIFFSEATLQELGADSWGDEIEDALRASKIFIALGTKEEYFNSYWIQRERTTFLTLKRDDKTKSKTIYSYIAPPMTTQSLPADIREFECFEEIKPNEFERLYSFISNRLFGNGKEDKDEEIIYPNPYKGLQSFTYEDRENYYGREDESKTIAQTLKNTRLFSLLGASGSGKSSFIFAGILPLVKEDGVEILSLRPLDDPFKSLASAFIPTLYPDKIDQIEKKDKLTNKLINLDVKLNNLVETFLEEKKSTKLYLFIDQFEELFTLTKEQKIRNLFLDQLLNLIDSNINISLLISMRSDFLSHISYYEPFNQAFNSHHNHVLGLFGREHLREVIEKPSQNLGVTFQNGLVEKIIDEIAKEAGQLPLLEFALHQLWIHKKGRIISFESLKEIKSISKSISHYADGVYEKHIKMDSSIKRIFINLVSIGRGTEDTKKRAKLDEFRDEDRETITLLANERLIVTNENEIEIVHEALIREWRQLKEWVDEYRDFLQWQERIREDRVFYGEKGDLLKDSKLLVAKDFLKSHREYISPLDEKFINKSINTDNIKRRNQWLLIGFIFLFLVGIIFFILSLRREASNTTETLIKVISKYGENGFENYIQNNTNALATFDFIITNFKESKKTEIAKIVSTAYVGKGLIFDNKKEYKLALEMQKKAIVLNPKYAKAYYNIGNIYLHQESYNDAILWYEKSIKIDPNIYQVYNNLGNIYISKKKYKEALAYFAKSISLNLNNDVLYYNLGVAYSCNKEYANAIKAYSKAISINSKNIWVYAQNIFELQLIQQQSFDKKLEKRYTKLFQNQKETFIHYEMLKILQDIVHNKKVDLEQWKQKYYGVELGWNFDELHEWIDRIENEEMRGKLVEALGVFEGHGRAFSRENTVKTK